MDALTWLVEHYVELLVAIVGVITAANVLVAALRKLVDLCGRLANLTETDVDNRALQALSRVLWRTSEALEWLEQRIRPLTLRRRGSKGK